MYPKNRSVFARIVFAAAVLSAAVLCIPAAHAADDLTSILSKLDTAATQFHTTAADVEFDSTQTDPIPDTDVQKGKVYYQRTGSAFEMGVHIETDNGQPAPKVIVCCTKGAIQLYEKLPNHVTTLSKLSHYEDWFMLGFGASGKELAAKWTIKLGGMETVDGVKTAKLEMTAKDANVRRTIPMVTIWIDPVRGVSLKQVFDEVNGQSKTCLYTHIQVNQTLPKDAFSFTTDKQTRFTTQ